MFLKTRRLPKASGTLIAGRLGMLHLEELATTASNTNPSRKRQRNDKDEAKESQKIDAQKSNGIYLRLSVVFLCANILARVCCAHTLQWQT